jgi:hypothetical protein
MFLEEMTDFERWTFQLRHIAFLELRRLLYFSCVQNGAKVTWLQRYANLRVRSDIASLCILEALHESLRIKFSSLRDTGPVEVPQLMYLHFLSSPRYAVIFPSSSSPLRLIDFLRPSSINAVSQ